MDIPKTNRVWILYLTVWTVMVDLILSEKHAGGFTKTRTYVHDGEEIWPDINPDRNVYLKNVERVWVLQEETGVWALIFQNMSIEDSASCQHDYLEIREIYDGANKTGYQDLLEKRYCGSDVPRPFISQRPHVEVHFITDGLWEMKGFHIKAIHALNADILRRKIRKYTGGQPRNLYMDNNKRNADNTKSNKEGTIFYILIAAAAIALIIFGTLLTYFIMTMRKMNDRREREPELYFIPGNHSSPTKNSNHVITKKQKRNTFNIDIENSGRRYTRGKLTTLSSPVCQTINEHSKDSETLSHHNNLYVSNFNFTGN